MENLVRAGFLASYGQDHKSSWKTIKKLLKTKIRNKFGQYQMVAWQRVIAQGVFSAR
jgi:predicted component of type VI protein secretion system